MRYCADTWYLLGLFSQEPKAVRILENAKSGKDWILIPLVVFAEATKKLLQRGVSQQKIDAFFEATGDSEKVRLVFPEKMIASEAARVSLTYNVPLLDAFVAATAKISNCDALLSGDSDYDLAKRKYIKVQSW